MEYVRIRSMELILASNSPRRRQILALGGWDFRVQAVEVDEQVLPGETPHSYVLRLARWKALAAARRAAQAGYVIAADTTVVDRGQGKEQASTAILSKPGSPAEAVSMLRQLGGRAHLVLTGLAVIHPVGGRMESEVVETEVVMRSYGEAEIQAYVATGDPLDKAGAYAIQHADFHPVEKITGCYANVVGLPLCALTRILGKFGIAPASEVARHCQNTGAGELCAVAPLLQDGPKNRSNTGRISPEKNE